VIPPMAAPFQPQSVASLIDEGADHVHSDRRRPRPVRESP
jgi:hypothetical protein